MTSREKILELCGEYVLVHKSHIRTIQGYDLVKGGYVTRSDIMVTSSDVCPDVEVLYSKSSLEELLEQYRDWTVDKLIRYLEAPATEQK